MNSVQSSVTSNQLEGKRPLPEGWVWTTLEECVDILDNRRVPINSDEREQRIAGKEQSELFPYYGATGLVGWIDDFIFDEEIVLLGEDGAPFLETTKNKAYIVRGKCWVNNHAHVLRAKSGITTNLFMMHYLNLFDYHGYVTGTTRLKLNQGRMREFHIILPPLPEQERIVARLEELLSDLEAGVAALRRVRAGAKRYKASVLKAACEGKLLESRGAESSESGLPEGWRWAELGDLLDFKNGINFSKDQKGEKGIPTVDVLNMYSQGLRVSLDALYRVDIQLKNNDYVLRNGDVLFVRSSVKREGVGWASLFGGSSEPISFCGFIIRGRPISEDVFPDYLCYYLRSDSTRQMIVASSSQVTITNINQGALGRIPVPLPPLEEQLRIVAEVERRLESAWAVESAVEVGLKRAARLRQAVLRSAFEGRL